MAAPPSPPTLQPAVAPRTNVETQTVAIAEAVDLEALDGDGAGALDFTVRALPGQSSALSAQGAKQPFSAFAGRAGRRGNGRGRVIASSGVLHIGRRQRQAVAKDQQPFTDEMLRQYRQALDDDPYFRGRAGTDMLDDEYPRAADGLHDGAGGPRESPCTSPAARHAAMHPEAAPRLAYCAGGAGAGAMQTTI